jgi:hypothetical protein
VQQARASVQNIDAQMAGEQAQISASQTQLDQAQTALVFAQQQATRLSDAGARRLGHRLECPAVHVATASAKSGCPDRTRKPRMLVVSGTTVFSPMQWGKQTPLAQQEG